ncbi:nitroreductase [Bacillus cereus]|nr:nitroreductase [Bacillus cereus]
MGQYEQMLLVGTIMSIILSIMIWGSLYYNPRLWLNDYPKDIQKSVLPKTITEKRQTLYFGIVYNVILFGTPLISTFLLNQYEKLLFIDAFLHSFGILMIFNLVDLLIIDWLIFCWITPRFVVIPSTEGMRGYKNYRMHLRGAMIGTPFLIIVSLFIAGIGINI